MIDVFAAAQLRSFDPNCANRAWLATECEALIAAGNFASLGGLMLYVALAVAPLQGLRDLVGAATLLPFLSAGEAHPTDPAWVAAEMRLHLAGLVAADSDLVTLAINAAGALRRVL